MTAFQQISVAVGKGFVRDKASLFFTFLLPLFFLVLFGILFGAMEGSESTLEPIQYIAPGILSFGIAMSAVFASALTLVSWRENGLLRKLQLAPVSPFTILTSRFSVTVIVAVLQAALFFAVAFLPFFGLRLESTWWMAVPLFLLGVLSFFSLGILIGSVFKTDQSASAASNLIVLPLGFLSGTFFPLDFAPSWMDTVSLASPLRHMNDGMLALLVRGEGPEALLVPCGALLLFALITTGLAGYFLTRGDQ
ncbi:ABC transporter permease [Nocardiopsis xinjiangensis]|uniref:ABC transporter permease n=1 Tax=Nocardiopsis xinjiangensis TaxID=124285 RepID=UPI000344EF4B|nr:ABC transporter permease [Nocardiopsis xinjiangensis]